MALTSIVRIIDDPNAIKIALEPTRRRILFLLNSSNMTVSQIAAILQKDLSTIYRHIHKLEEAGLIEPCGERIVHHTSEKVYRRIATHFLFSSESLRSIDKNILAEYAESTSNSLRLLLEEMGYEIERDEEYEQSCQKMILRWNELSSEGIKKLVDKEKKISLWMYLILTIMLSLIRFENDPELKKESTVFVSKIKNRKQNRFLSGHSP